MTREELARFVLQVAEGSYAQEDWERIAVNHYPDKKMEEARVKLVRYVSGYAAPPEQAHLSLKELLIAMAADLKSSS